MFSSHKPKFVYPFSLKSFQTLLFVRHLLITSSLMVSLCFSFSFAQNYATVVIKEESLIFEGQKGIRYLADYDKQIVTLFEIELIRWPGKYPEGYKVNAVEGNLEISVGDGFTVTRSTDEKQLVITKGQVLGSEPEAIIEEDERAPIIYRLSNADPSETAGLLRSMYDGLKVEVDDRQRALMVMVNKEDRALIDELVERLDMAMPQVVFEAEIIEINQNVTQSLGINYDSLFTFTLAEDSANLATGGLLAMGPISRSSPFSLTVGLSLLKANGAADVLARPRVTTLDGVQAQLNATQSFPVVVSSSDGQESVQNITTGIQMTFLPKISPNGFIESDLSISVSTPTGITSQQVPTFSSREASTTVRVANGEQIVIGGLYEKRELKGEQKVPLLGDIPFLGALFTSTSIEQRETDLVIVVTPRIVETQGLPTIQTQDE